MMRQAFKQQVFALEVKSGTQTYQIGLRAFQETYPNAKLILVGQEGMGREEFFQTTIPTLLGRYG